MTTRSLKLKVLPNGNLTVSHPAAKLNQTGIYQVVEIPEGVSDVEVIRRTNGCALLHWLYRTPNSYRFEDLVDGAILGRQEEPRTNKETA